MSTAITTALQKLPVAAELQYALLQTLAEPHDVTLNPLWRQAMADLGRAFALDSDTIAPFLDAWELLCVMTLVLDHLQDGDLAAETWLAAQPPSVQYHLAFTLYAAAHHTLTHLDPQRLPVQRIDQIQTLWAATVLQLASGQFLDLTQHHHGVDRSLLAPLDGYEQIATAKTGTTFALALGGIAILATDDPAVHEAALQAGLLYGRLIQYRDDLADAPTQRHQGQPPTFGHSLLAQHPQIGDAAAAAPLAFWALTYSQYLEALTLILAPLPASVADVVLALVYATFSPPSAQLAQDVALHPGV